MLSRFTTKNFRSFREIDLELRPLTIVMGTNGAGKTSILRLLRILQQTVTEKDKGHFGPIKLNGSLVQLGEARKILPSFDAKKHWSIDLELPAGRFQKTLHDSMNSLVESFSYQLEELYYYIDRILRRSPDEISGHGAELVDRLKSLVLTDEQYAIIGMIEETISPLLLVATSNY